MFSSIRIKGIGPHTDTTLALDPEDASLIEGHSQSGKSLVVDAICFALWGTDRSGKPFPVEAIAEGAKVADVELTTASGSVVHRRMDRGRNIQRSLIRGGETYDRMTEADLAHRLGPISQPLGDGKGAVPAGRLLLAPMSWRDLALGAGGGRPLRDVLDQVVPGGDLGAIIGQLLEADGDALRPDDCRDPRGAGDQRRAARKRRDEATGQLSEAEGALSAIGEEPESVAVDLDVASAVLSAASEWVGYDRAMERHATAAARHDEWLERRAAIGERPEYDKAELARAQGVLQRSRTAVQGAERALTQSQAQLEAADRALEAEEAGDVSHDPDVVAAQQDLEQAEHALSCVGDTCPTCGQEWHGALEAAEQAVETAHRDLGRITALAVATLAAAAADAGPEAARLRALIDRQEQELSAAREEAERVEQALYEHEAAAQSLREHDAAMRALGREPSVPAAPAPPGGARPSDEAAREAQAALDEARRIAGAAEERRRQREVAEQRVGRARSAVDAATEAAAHADRLVEAVRRAPSVRLARSLEALGDLGPVSLALPEKGGVEVLVDGRPWWLASTGRLVVADLCFRLALRRALGMTWWPLAVDDAQAWSGAWPEVDGPTILLRTVRCELRSSAARGEMAR